VTPRCTVRTVRTVRSVRKVRKVLVRTGPSSGAPVRTVRVREARCAECAGCVLRRAHEHRERTPRTRTPDRFLRLGGVAVSPWSRLSAC
jgi:hypothetical protein